MLTQIISQYLKSHRRLNIPSVGAFMVKGSNSEIIFSELLKSDDGVLTSLLAEQGLNEMEIASVINHFAFELNHSTDAVGGEFEMSGFGVLRREENRRLTFVSAPQIAEPVVEPVEEVVDVQEPEVTPAHEPIAEQPVAEQPIVEQTSSGTTSSRYTAERIKELYSSPQKFREKDPALGNLTYSKRQKSLDGYTFVESGAKKRGVDKVLLFGIIAAVIAAAVIAYGYYVGYVVNGEGFADSADENPIEQVEQVESPAAVEPGAE